MHINNKIKAFRIKRKDQKFKHFSFTRRRNDFQIHKIKKLHYTRHFQPDQKFPLSNAEFRGHLEFQHSLIEEHVNLMRRGNNRNGERDFASTVPRGIPENRDTTNAKRFRADEPQNRWTVNANPEWNYSRRYELCSFVIQNAISSRKWIRVVGKFCGWCTPRTAPSVGDFTMYVGFKRTLNCWDAFYWLWSVYG